MANSSNETIYINRCNICRRSTMAGASKVHDENSSRNGSWKKINGQPNRSRNSDLLKLPFTALSEGVLNKFFITLNEHNIIQTKSMARIMFD